MQGVPQRGDSRVRFPVLRDEESKLGRMVEKQLDHGRSIMCSLVQVSNLDWGGGATNGGEYCAKPCSLLTRGSTEKCRAADAPRYDQKQPQTLKSRMSCIPGG